MKKVFNKRILAIALNLVMVLQYVPTMAFAVETDNLCANHTEHTADCGYIAPVTEEPEEAAAPTCTCTARCETANADCERCKDDHTACGYIAPVTEEPEEAAAPTCTCIARCETANADCALCKDEHTSCGYTAPVAQPEEEDPVAAVQALVDALPDTVTLENKEAVGEQLNALIRAYQSLEAAQQAQVDLTKYETTIAAMYELEGQAGAQTPVTTGNYIKNVDPYYIIGGSTSYRDWLYNTFRKIWEGMPILGDSSNGYYPRSVAIKKADGNYVEYQSYDYSTAVANNQTTFEIKAYYNAPYANNYVELYTLNVQQVYEVTVSVSGAPSGYDTVTNTDGKSMVGTHRVTPGGSFTMRIWDNIPGYRAKLKYGDQTSHYIDMSGSTTYKDYTSDITGSVKIQVSYGEAYDTVYVNEEDSAVSVTISVDGKTRSLPTYLPKYTDITQRYSTEYTYTATTTDGYNITEVMANGQPVYSGDPGEEVTFNITTPKDEDELKLTFTTVVDLSSSAYTVTLEQNAYTYTGSPLTPAILLNGSKLSTDYYTATYTNNTNQGTATVTVTGKNGYTGTKTLTFTINKANISGATVTLSPPPALTAVPSTLHLPTP